MMYFHTAKVHYLLYYSRIKTKPRQKQLFMTWGRILHLGARASHTQRPPKQPATLCRPQPGPTHQRAQQPALPPSTTNTARNLVSHPNLRAIPSPPSQTAPAAPAAAVQCSRSQSQAGSIRAVTSKQGVVPPEVAAACCCCFNGRCKSSSCSSPLVSNSISSLQARTTTQCSSVLNCCCCGCCCAVLSLPVSSSGNTSCYSDLATPAPLLNLTSLRSHLLLLS